MAIIDRYAGLVVDLDGVVFSSDELIRGAGTFLRRTRRARPPIVYVTNNSTRTSAEWAEAFARHKVTVDPDRIVSSAVATAEVLATTQAGPCYVLGEYGLRAALRDAGVTIVDEAADAQCVVVGLDRTLSYEKLRDAARAIRRGARFIATNPDRTLPTPDGPVPGTGATLDFLRSVTGAAPEIIGKPMTGLFDRAKQILAVDGPVLVVGDRLSTDVVAARAMGWDAALVRTGVDGWPALVGGRSTPTWVMSDLAALDGPEPPVVRHARESDLSAIRELLAASAFDVDGAAGRVRTTLVAEDAAGKIVGTAAWELVGSAAHLRGITVAESERGLGCGAHLVARALNELRTSGVEWAYLLTPGADQLFEQLGFWRVHRDRVPEEILATAQYGGPADGAIALVRRLSA